MNVFEEFEGKSSSMHFKRKFFACLAVLAMTSASLKMAEASCQPVESNVQSSSPKMLKVNLSGNVNDYMEAELIYAFESNLTQFPDIKTIKIELFSTGGSIYPAFRIHNYLKGLHERNGLQVIVHNASYVESAAISIYCGGNQRIVSPYSSFMVHEYSHKIDSRLTLTGVQNKIEDIDTYQKAGERLVSACTKLTSDQAAELINEHTYLDPEQALELGLAHSIQPASYDRQVDIQCRINGDNQPSNE